MESDSGNGGGWAPDAAGRLTRARPADKRFAATKKPPPPGGGGGGGVPGDAGQSATSASTWRVPAPEAPRNPSR